MLNFTPFSKCGCNSRSDMKAIRCDLQSYYKHLNLYGSTSD